MQWQLTHKNSHGSFQNTFHTATSPLQTILHILHKHVGGENIHLHVSGFNQQILIPVSTVTGTCLLPITY